MIIVERHPRKVIDDFGDKKPTDTAVWIYEKGTPLPLRHICSEEHFRQIVEQGIKYLTGTDAGYKTSEPAGESAELDGLKSTLEARDAEVEMLTKQIEAKDGMINELNRRITENKPRQARTATSMKGKGRKK